MARTFEERFFEKVVKGAKPDDCWAWTGAHAGKGYGHLRAMRRGVYAHRYSWELANGPIPDGLWVLHRCDNPPCCNPAHLFLGTNNDNIADASAKGRLACGERNGGAKLTEASVREIRRLWPTWKGTQGTLGRLFGITRSHISHIVNRKNWKEIDT